MITNAMNYQEIAATFKRDFENELANLYQTCFGLRAKYGKYVCQNVGPEQYKFLGKKEYISKNKNKYVFLFCTRGKKQYKQMGIERNYWLEYMRSDGIHAVRFNHETGRDFTFYTPHFFDRYRERFLEPQFDIEDWTKPDVIEDYFKNNVVFNARPMNDPRYPNSLFVVSEDGIALGEDIGKGIWEFRTFITFEMLKGNQVNISEEEGKFLEIMKKLHESGKLTDLLAYVQ